MTASSSLDVKSATSGGEIYSDSAARQVLDFLLRSPRALITPEIVATDEIRYKQLEPTIISASAEAEDLLSRMMAAGVLVADVVDQAPACPECGSHKLSTRYLCPRCLSFDITHSFLYEHLKCGKVASDDTFKKGDKLVCPKCQTILHNYGVEFRAVGAWYKCNKCNESFSTPALSHFCRDKRHQFTTDRTRLVPVHQYRLNPSALNDVRREILKHSEVVTILEGLGLTVTAPHVLAGKSGQPQSFDIVVTAKRRWGGNKTIVIDTVSSDGGVRSETVRDFAAKVKDVRPTESYLITVPGLADDARVVAQNLKIAFVEAPSMKEATTALLGRGAFKDIRSSLVGAGS